jgi:hypothetical protein
MNNSRKHNRRILFCAATIFLVLLQFSFANERDVPSPTGPVWNQNGRDFSQETRDLRHSVAYSDQTVLVGEWHTSNIRLILTSYGSYNFRLPTLDMSGTFKIYDSSGLLILKCTQSSSSDVVGMELIFKYRIIDNATMVLVDNKGTSLTYVKKED